LKSPHHALNLEALTTVYPDARLVLLHRDPIVLCASVCSLIHTLSGTFSDADHRPYIADHWVALLEESIRRIDRFRATRPEHAIIDIRYDDLLRDPVAAVESIYSAFDDNGSGGLDADAHAALTDYVAAHPKDSLGVHGYDLAEFGLDPARLRERFSDYVARYDVPEERRAR
jgi:hypothetical protein